MTWSEQHRHARHWVFRELDRLIEQRSPTEGKKQPDGHQQTMPQLIRLRVQLVGLLRQVRGKRAR